MKNLKEFNLGLFFTRNISLYQWANLGLINREIKLYKELAKHFGKIYLFTYGDFRDQNYCGLFPENVYIITKPKFIPVFIYSFILPFIHINKLRNINFLKTNQMDGSWAAVIAKKIYRSKLIIRCGYEWLSFIERQNKGLIKRLFALWVEKYAYNNADQIIVTSEGDRDFILKRFKVDKSKITVIPNYVDTEIFKALSIKKEPNRLISIGRLDKQKNFANLIEALKGTGIDLIIIGDGILKSELQLLSTRNSLSVKFLKNMPQPNLVEELNRSEIFVLPSLYEGNPKVLLEAMACGLPCIGTDVPGIREGIRHNEDGIISQTDPESLRSAIINLLENKELRDKLGKQAREKILKFNSFQVYLDKELSVYKSFDI
jgi:glycosyltransferase involved in cell wall biosynthesis